MDSWRGWWRTDGQTPVFAHETTCACGVMPLPPDVATLPLAVYEMRTGEKLDSDGKIARILWARAMTLGWLWLLVVSAWRLGRAAGGPWGGRIASGLIAADPNFLGHAALATTDVAISASLMAFARAVYAGRGGGWWPRVVLPGLWYGVAVLCKLSGLLYGGIILVALEVCHRFASGELSRPIGGGSGAWARKFALAVVRSVLAAAAVIAIGVTLAVLFCGLPDEGSEPFKRVANAVPPDEPLRPVFRRWAEHAGRLPNAGCAFAFQWWWNARGRPTFLNGTYYPEGYRWFFPELLMMKVPIPVMAVFLLALPRPRALANPLTLAALLLFAVLTQANLQLGFRFAFPALALAYVAVAVALARGYPRCAPFLGVPAILAVAAISAWVWPHGIGYLNQLYGGPGQAHRRVTDSNSTGGRASPNCGRGTTPTAAADRRVVLRRGPGRAQAAVPTVPARIAAHSKPRGSAEGGRAAGAGGGVHGHFAPPRRSAREGRGFGIPGHAPAAGPDHDVRAVRLPRRGERAVTAE